MGIKAWQSSVAYPEVNGQVEVVNKLIFKPLNKALDKKKGKWVEALPVILWAIRTTARGLTQETPFMLTYGSDATAPIKMALPTARVAYFNDEQNEQQHALDLK